MCGPTSLATLDGSDGAPDLFRISVVEVQHWLHEGQAFHVAGLQDLSSPTRDGMLGPLQWKRGALTAGRPGKSPNFLFLLKLEYIGFG